MSDKGGWGVFMVGLIVGVFVGVLTMNSDVKASEKKIKTLNTQNAHLEVQVKKLES